MKIGVLTSSRADYGIYLPLLNKLKIDSFFNLEIIAFGTHLSTSHGYTIDQVIKDGYTVIHEISSLISNDNEQSIASSYGLTTLKFADFWSQNNYDLVLCLGDRFEMSAAVQSSIPFGIKLAHFHGGETTLGAIDNIYRHQITLASKIHFTATEIFASKVKELTNQENNIFNVGSLSLDDMPNYEPIEKSSFLEKYGINEDYVLVTFHPETVSPQENIKYALEIKESLAQISKNLYVVITMPNADTLGSVFRTEIEKLKKENSDRIILIENFGKINYFSAMYYSKLLIGNTSSGILEAASFNKYVVNVGDRQKGRVQSSNIFNCSFDADEIISVTNEAISKGEYIGENVYFQKDVALNIIKVIKNNK